MLIKRSRPQEPRPSEVTPEAVWRERRSFVRAAGLAGAAAAGGLWSASGVAATPVVREGGNPRARKLPAIPDESAHGENLTSYQDVTTYNNFYEFGTEKSDPARTASSLKTRPWTVAIEGAIEKPGNYGIEDLMALAPLEERIYRMRCVEGWSMVIPWIGFPFARLIEKVQPTSAAKFVEFVTLDDPRQMPGLAYPVLHWPYVEGLRIDEANHPLTLLTFGLYGEVLPNQNGAPIRFVVPWKYGFKSGKSVVKIRFREHQPMTSWNRAAPHEYGFYSNVNPEVDHPRWSQATERRIGEDGFFQRKRPTLMFNGYAEQVASLYSGMDLRKFY